LYLNSATSSACEAAWFGSAAIFFYSCCEKSPIHNNNQRAVLRVAFWFLHLCRIAGWLWRNPQAEQTKQKSFDLLKKKKPLL
jgi:hypothetical protein